MSGMNRLGQELGTEAAEVAAEGAEGAAKASSRGFGASMREGLTTLMFKLGRKPKPADEVAEALARGEARAADAATPDAPNAARAADAATPDVPAAAEASRMSYKERKAAAKAAEAAMSPKELQDLKTARAREREANVSAATKGLKATVITGVGVGTIYAGAKGYGYVTSKGGADDAAYDAAKQGYDAVANPEKYISPLLDENGKQKVNDKKEPLFIIQKGAEGKPVTGTQAALEKYQKDTGTEPEFFAAKTRDFMNEFTKDPKKMIFLGAALGLGGAKIAAGVIGIIPGIGKPIKDLILSIGDNGLVRGLGWAMVIGGISSMFGYPPQKLIDKVTEIGKSTWESFSSTTKSDDSAKSSGTEWKVREAGQGVKQPEQATPELKVEAETSVKAKDGKATTPSDSISEEAKRKAIDASSGLKVEEASSTIKAPKADNSKGAPGKEKVTAPAP